MAPTVASGIPRELERCFDGTVDAWGYFQDRGGKVVRCFKVEIQCRWEGDDGGEA
jgi:hypothetical protein